MIASKVLLIVVSVFDSRCEILGLETISIKDLNILEPGEIQEAMDAAASVGDDRIQEKVQGYANPETFTHGTSDERVAWFTKGYDSGSIIACDTFK